MLSTVFFAALASLTQPTIESCTQIDAPTERLACFDEATGRKVVKSEMGNLTTETVQPAPIADSRPVLEAPRSEAEYREALRSNKKKSKGSKPAALTGDIAKIDMDARDRLTITLTNGQVWRQLDSDRPQRINSKNPPSSVTIVKGAFGSYKLFLDDRTISLRVKRTN